jgi:hypothetical protein
MNSTELSHIAFNVSIAGCAAARSTRRKVLDMNQARFPLASRPPLRVLVRLRVASAHLMILIGSVHVTLQSSHLSILPTSPNSMS